MMTIDELKNQFTDAISRNDKQGCIDSCFHILYGLPEKTQLELAQLMVGRYLPIFHSRWPDVNWPQTILEQPAAWFDRHGREVPEEPDPENPADAAFVFCFDALLNAIANPANPVVVTSSYMSAINVAIDARSTNVWMADDPEAVKMWEKQGYFPGRSAEDNSAAIAVTEREWRIAGDWLFAKEHIELFNNSVASEAAQALKQWKETELTLIVPPDTK